jgi:hypothetical protein
MSFFRRKAALQTQTITENVKDCYISNPCAFNMSLSKSVRILLKQKQRVLGRTHAASFHIA